MTSSDGIKTQLKIRDICGTKTVSRKDGKKMYELILKNWDESQHVEVDFGNLTIASVSFLDEALGQLAMKFSKPEIVSKLKLRRISERDKRLLNDIFISRYRQQRIRAGK